MRKFIKVGADSNNSGGLSLKPIHKLYVACSKKLPVIPLSAKLHPQNLQKDAVHGRVEL